MVDRSLLFWVTNAIAQGAYPLDEDFGRFRRAGITHLLNLDLPYVSVPADGLAAFEAVILQTIPDGRRVPDAKALEILDALHGALLVPDAKVYVHCHAGVSRSPTVVFLYLLACGRDAETVAERFGEHAAYARPGNPGLVDMALMDRVRAHGRDHYLPHPRPEAIAWPQS